MSHYGEQDGECFYVMELVEGETLEARVRREGPMPLALALEVIEQASRALAAAEACGVVHRDIKPSNIMLESDPSGALIVKVIDYGIAKVGDAQAEPDAEKTQSGFLGTPAFASPEQFAASEQTKIDTRSDIYSLGVTFWYLLSGRVPFVGRTLNDIRERQTKPLPIEQLKVGDVPSRILALLKSMLAADPKDRPQSARELLSGVHRCYTKFSVEARLRRKRFIVRRGRSDGSRRRNRIRSLGISTRAVFRRARTIDRGFALRKSQCEWRRHLFHRGNAGRSHRRSGEASWNESDRQSEHPFVSAR